MKKLSTPQKRLMLILILMGMGIFIITLLPTKDATTASTEPAAVDSVILSHESGFYAEPLTLEISGDTITEIYYTLDGSDPSRDNQTALPYTDGILIDSGEKELPCTVRILAYFEDGTTSSIINRTFITGESVHTRFDVPVLTLTAPEGFFLDDKSGIFYGENRFKMSDANQEAEVFMTLLDETGNVLLSQNCGLKIHGHFSRNKNQPSFRLLARSEYDEQNDFEYVLFDDQYSAANTLISEHKRFIVRNSGNDNGHAFIRSELASKLSLDAGFTDAPHATPVAVYLNDTYYGFYWLVNHFNETYYRETYGDYDGTMYTLTGVINELSVEESGDDETTASLVADYNEKIARFSTCDLNEEENWTALNEFIDVENFLQYAAIQNYVCNMDALHNNFKVYRYVAAPGEEYRPNSVFDGKYRFLLYDLDFGFGYVQQGVVMSSVDNLTTHILLIQERDSYTFFQNLLKRADCQDYYVRYMLSLQNRYFAPEYANAVLDEMHGARANELRYTYTTTDLLLNNDCASNVTCDEDIQVALDDVRNFINNRSTYITEDMAQSFGPFTRYAVMLDNANEANITLDFAQFNDSYFCGMYYQEIPLQVQANPKPGYRFDHWLINGEPYEEAAFEVAPEMILEGMVYLECICSPNPDAELTITAVKPNTGDDYIELTNLGSTPRYLNNYYLTDADNGMGSSLPAIALAGGETITIYCNNYSGLDALGQPYVDFNLKAGETLSLYKNSQSPIQTVAIPSLGTENGIYKMDMATGEFREVSRD